MNPRLFPTLALVCALVALTGARAAAQSSCRAPGYCALEWPDPSVSDAATQAKAEKLAQGFQGAFLIARRGRVIAAKGMGLANRASGEQNSTTTRFRLASVSKPITAIAIMQLWEKGKLDPRDKVTKHLPDYGPNGDKLEIHHLLTHSSGIPEYIPLVGPNPSSTKQIIDSFRERPLQFTPGSRFAYSNSNYALLGYIIEAVTGKTYRQYVESQIFRQANMLQAGYEFPKAPGEGFAAPDGGDPNGPWESSHKAYAAGALYASVNDMFFLNHALYNGLLLRPDTVRTMQTAYVGKWGYGFVVSDGEVSHNGLIHGFTAQLYSYPQSEGIVIVFSNGKKAAPALASKLRSLLN